MNDYVMKPNRGKTCQAPYDQAPYLNRFKNMRFLPIYKFATIGFILHNNY